MYFTGEVLFFQKIRFSAYCSRFHTGSMVFTAPKGVIVMNKSLARAAVLLFLTAVLSLSAGVPAALADSGLLQSGPRPGIGCLPPHFKLPTPEGEEMDIGIFKGKVILLTFCSGYTDPCCKLVRTLNALLDRYEDQGVIAPLIVSELPKGASRTKCSGVTDIIGKRFPTMIDENKQLKLSFKVVQLPTTFVIGRDFCIREMVRGEAVFYTPEFRTSLEALIAERPAAGEPIVKAQD